MIYAAYGLVFGLFIPYLARRFSKFMPATPAYALYRILKPVRSVSRAKRAGNPEYRRLMTRYRMRSIGWGIVAAAISYLAAERFSDIYIVWYLGLIWTLLLLTEIDNRMMLLPDILTVPLLIAGFAYSVFVSQWVIPAESVLGAVTGYMLPVVASAFLVWKNKDAFGGGDIKLLAALGAWLGYGAGNIYDDFGQRAVCAVCAGTADAGRRFRAGDYDCRNNDCFLLFLG